MQVRLRSLRLLAAATVIFSTGCRTTAGGAGSSAAAADGGQAKPNITWRRVAPENIERLIAAANNLTGPLAAMNGLWYCRAGACRLGLTTGVTVMTLAHAQVLDDHSARFGVYDPLSYGFNGNSVAYQFTKDKTQYRGSDFSYYVLKIDSPGQGHLDMYSLKNGTLVPAAKSTYDYTMTQDPSDEDHWVRKTVFMGQQFPNYDLYRIIGADGVTRTKHYEKYLNDINSAKAQLVISVPTGSDLATSDDIIGKDGTIKDEVQAIHNDPPADTADSSAASDQTDDKGGVSNSDSKGDAGKR